MRLIWVGNKTHYSINRHYTEVKMKQINTSGELAKLLNTGKIVVFDQPAKQWIVFDNLKGEYNETVVNISNEQIRTLNRLSETGFVHRDNFKVTDSEMLISYMSCTVAENNKLQSQTLDIEM